MLVPQDGLKSLAMLVPQDGLKSLAPPRSPQRCGEAEAPDL